MATQIAATPILKGEEAMKVMREAQQKPDEKAKRAFALLEAEFAGMIAKRD